jgi:hypothetical protein
VRSILLPVRDDRHPRMKRAGGYGGGWAAARERSRGGCRPWFGPRPGWRSKRVSGVLTAALDRGTASWRFAGCRGRTGPRGPVRPKPDSPRAGSPHVRIAKPIRKRPDSALQAGLGRTSSESVPRVPLPSVTRQELSELREGHVLRDETPAATGKAFLRPVANDAPAAGYRLDVAPAAALLARRLNGNCQLD